MHSRTAVGSRGESAAAKFLSDRGYFVWKMNWKCRRGEIDIVAYRGHELVFVEVKSSARQDTHIFDPLDKIDALKERKLRRLAERFIESHTVELKARRLWSIRIDAIRVAVGRWWKRPVIAHIENYADFSDELTL